MKRNAEWPTTVYDSRGLRIQPLADTKPGNYYVLVIDGTRWSLLLGPFVDNHQAALNMVSLVRDMACELDCNAPFYTFGTCRLEKKAPAGKLNQFFGLKREDK